MKKAIYYMYREILLAVKESIERNKRYQDCYERFPWLEKDINDLEPKFKKIVSIDFDDIFCEELYEEVIENGFLEDVISDMKSDLEDDAIETGKRDDAYDYPSKELAIPVTGLEGFYLGFTSYFGGGKYDDKSWILDITETCKLLTVRKETKIVQVFDRVNI